MMGMTVFLIVSYVYPNAQHLRPTEFPRDNIFTDISVQRRINESIDEIENLENKIKEILYVLQDKDEEVVRNLNNIKNEYILFIEEAN